MIHERTLIDNSSVDLSMSQTLKECITKEGIQFIRIATGYWDMKGMALVYDELKAFLDKEGTILQLLIGKDPYVYANQLKNPTLKDYKYPNDFVRRHINDLKFVEEDEKIVRLLLDHCEGENAKFQIRLYNKNAEDESQFLHSKCYIFTGKDRYEWSLGIVGSSNFTKQGLEGNAELNYLENERRIINWKEEDGPGKGHKQWFNEKWELAEPWNQEFLEQVLRKTPIAKKVEKDIKKEKEQRDFEKTIEPLTPYEVYIKLLQTRFGDLVDKNLQNVIESYLPDRYDSYEYQIDAVKQCFSTMKQHGGFLLADVVGLGKTVVGTLVIKHFLNYPDEDGREHKVLIVTPPAIRSAWEDTIEEFDKDCVDPMAPHIDFITTGSIGNLVDDIDETDDDIDSDSFKTELKKDENYGLIIIDESHKFRNSDNSMYHALNELVDQICGDTGNYPYVGLLSATPQNNRPNDLKNQIYLFERNHNDSSLKKANGGNIESFFAEVNREYASLLSNRETANTSDGSRSDEVLTPKRRQERLKEISMKIRDCVLSDIMIRRTRTDVKKYYGDDLRKQGIVFPDIKGPIGLTYKMSTSLARLFSDSMNLIAPTEDFSFDNPDYLCYYRYRAVQFLTDPENKRLYAGRGNRDADALALQLARIMQINLVKRLESSFAAFRQSLLNLRRYTNTMIQMWENNTIFICPDIDVNKELNVEEKSIAAGRSISFVDCVEDVRRKIRELNENGSNNEGDNKEYTRDDFDANYINLLRHDYELICRIYDRWSINTEDPKFDEFKESLRYRLFDPEKNRPHKLVIFTEAIDTANSISAAAESRGYRVLQITAANRDNNENIIKENFDANYKGEWKNDYDIIVTTDVLAEGINLHRANCILNYDTPWNSTKLMQRIGRVNRIGSTEPNVYVFNFMPSAEGDAEINLVRKAHTKLQSFHTLFGEDSKIFSENEEIAHYDLDTVVNGEESPLEKYVYELKEYKASHPARYAEIEAVSEGLEISTVAPGGCGYFLVRTPRMAGMFVKVDPTEDEGQVISLIDLLAWVRPETTAEKVDLPEDWDSMKVEAERVVTAELADARNRRGNSKKATDAKGIIKHLKETQDMSAESKRLLSAADKLVRQGNNDIIKRILKINDAVETQNLLVPFTQEEFDAYLEEGIANMVADVQMRQGKPVVFIGINK